MCWSGELAGASQTLLAAKPIVPGRVKDALVEPADSIYFRASAAQRHGIRTRPARALHLERPRALSFAKISANSVDRAANARVTRQGNARRRWTVESEEGNQILGHTDLRRHPSTTERGEGTGQRADGRTGSGVTNRLGWIRPPVGRSDGAGDRLRGWE